MAVWAYVRLKEEISRFISKKLNESKQADDE